MYDQDQTGLGWTVVLRRQPARIVAGRAEGGYTEAYELVCCECGDHPCLDYSAVAPELRQIRGPFPIAEGIAAYQRHVSRYHSRPTITSQGAQRDRGTPVTAPGDSVPVTETWLAETVPSHR
jgi:hypothetical protein